MPLIADIVTLQDELTNSVFTYATIAGSISHPKEIRKQQVIPFIVDSGATTTTLAPYYTKAIGIDWEELPQAQSPCTIANGRKFYARVLDYPKIKFNVKDEDKKKQETFSPQRILVVPYSKKKKKIKPTPNLLGMDILSNFSNWEWNHANGKLYLRP